MQRAEVPHQAVVDLDVAIRIEQAVPQAQQLMSDRIVAGVPAGGSERHRAAAAGTEHDDVACTTASIRLVIAGREDISSLGAG